MTETSQYYYNEVWVTGHMHHAPSTFHDTMRGLEFLLHFLHPLSPTLLQLLPSQRNYPPNAVIKRLVIYVNVAIQLLVHAQLVWRFLVRKVVQRSVSGEQLDILSKTS